MSMNHKHAGGRPTKYQPIYCDLVIKEMAGGKSIIAFAAEIGVARSSINEWMDKHPEFSEAVKIGKAKCAAWWEERARAAAVGGGAPGQVTAIIFGLKNMAPEDWRDKQEINHSGQIDTSSKEQRDAAIAAALRANR